ncbi:uncharacterized protein LOC132721519 [Ruditapes philippinarum]|uniref:uncharacterized protein LOC132721519 n=1 Tax=Ruditapes philippinarum TaxID=129788 RepID=UPI00295BAD04|nr:uncharacterized protein LOC132721519 [Ruditapes philippinarum]
MKLRRPGCKCLGCWLQHKNVPPLNSEYEVFDTYTEVCHIFLSVMLVPIVKTARKGVVCIVQVDTEIAILSMDIVDQVVIQGGLAHFVTKIPDDVFFLIFITYLLYTSICMYILSYFSSYLFYNLSTNIYLLKSIILKIECNASFYGPNCTDKCSEHCAGGHGNCNTISGHCRSGCNPGWTGPLCDRV